MLLREANRQCLRLYRDESGVVLAISVVCFLILFVMACAVYAVGEAVRERIELQNTADAAAYSGAITQADTLSRVAAINRAMSWTYVKLVRMEMDAIVDKWLELVKEQWDRDENTITAYNATSCNQIRPTALWNGISLAQDRMVLLNYHHMESIYTVEANRSAAAGMGSGYSGLKPKIKTARDAIKEMNEAEQDLIDQLPTRIEETVRDVVKANIAKTFNDDDAGGADIEHCLIQDSGYFRILSNNDDDETLFLAHSDFFDGPRQTFDKGTNEWFVHDGGGEGLSRHYQQAGGSLIATWSWYTSHWFVPVATCVIDTFITGESTVRGSDGYDADYYETGTAKPQVLKEEFFGKKGAIVVGVRRKLNNPLAFFFSGGEPGIFKAFSVPGGDRHMWTVAAARAGYMSPNDEGDGKYEVTYEEVDIRKLWNLKTSDWDAVLLALHRAWADGKTGRNWDGETASQILQEVQGKLGVGGQSAPPKMNGGAFDPGSAEGWVVH